MLHKLLCLLFTLVAAIDLPENCKPGQYYNAGLMACASCNANISLVTSFDGFGCKCEENSVSVNGKRCMRCSATEVVSADGTTCVPRRCQKDSAGRVACRKCPADYISLTQNYDGSPMREVQCVKCTRGYKVTNNRCIKCDSCVCPKDQLVIADACLPKPFIVDRPKYEEGLLHPNDLLEMVKLEYFCTTGDSRACSKLANACVRSLYSSDRGGACRLWLKSSMNPRPSDLPPLVIDPFSTDGKKAGEFQLSSKSNTIALAAAIFTASGGLKFLRESRNTMPLCLLPSAITIGKDVILECNLNVTDSELLHSGESLAPYLNLNGDFRPLPVSIRKPTGYIVQNGEWSANKFRRYFLIDTSISGVDGVTNTLYLQTLTTFVRIQRDKTKTDRLSVHVSLEAQYATKSSASDCITTTFKVVNELPAAGVLRDLEIWGGVLGALLALYAVVQWRGCLRRGGLHVCLLPIMSGCIADALYFAALFSTLHALAVEATMLGLTLPLSHGEDHIIKSLIYAALSLKILKVAYINWKQCTCDVYFLDWSVFILTPEIDTTVSGNKIMVAREWSLMQTKRRVNPGYTITLALIASHFMSPWQEHIPRSQSYKWAIGTVSWWLAYSLLVAGRWLKDKLFGSPSALLPKLCLAARVSLLAFEEEYYFHYVHGRNDDSPETRPLMGPLAHCRVMCVPQIRLVFKQLSTPEGSRDDIFMRRGLLAKFLAAFFERALDGISWVATERTLLERLLDVEMTPQEAANTSALLYDNDPTPSCFGLTWWGAEWSLATAEAMVFGCILVTGGDVLLAALVTLAVWQISQHLRSWFGGRNLKYLNDIEPL